MPRGVDTRDESEAGFHEALAAANQANIVLMALGEAPDMSGEAESRTKLDLPGKQLKLLAGRGRYGQAGGAHPVQRPAPGDSVGS